jgi:hypothetical protein
MKNPYMTINNKLSSKWITTYTSSMGFETPEQIRNGKKQQIKSIIDGDKYLLQEIITELRNEKIEQIKDSI